MSNINSFTKIQIFALFISIISLCALASLAHAQENITDSLLGEVPENIPEERQVLIVGKPLVSDNTEGTLTIQFNVHNEMDIEQSFYYGIEVTTHELLGGQLVDEQGVGLHKLAANEEKILTAVYTVPTWLQDEIELHVSIYGEDGRFLDRRLVQRILLLGKQLDIEMFADSCVLNRGEDIKVLTSLTQTEPEEVLDFSCAVANNTDSEQSIVPVITLHAPIQNPETLSVKKGSPISIPPKETATIYFETKAAPQKGFYTVQFSLETNNLNSNSVVSNNLHNNVGAQQDDQVDVNTQKEKDTNNILYTVVSLLALLILLAILVYQRKQKEALSETLPPIEGDNNLEE